MKKHASVKAAKVAGVVPLAVFANIRKMIVNQALSIERNASARSALRAAKETCVKFVPGVMMNAPTEAKWTAAPANARGARPHGPVQSAHHVHIHKQIAKMVAHSTKRPADAPVLHQRRTIKSKGQMSIGSVVNALSSNLIANTKANSTDERVLAFARASGTAISVICALCRTKLAKMAHGQTNNANVFAQVLMVDPSVTHACFPKRMAVPMVPSQISQAVNANAKRCGVALCARSARSRTRTARMEARWIQTNACVLSVKPRKARTLYGGATCVTSAS